LRRPTKPMPIATRMSGPPVQKQALDAVTNHPETARGCEPERMVNAIAIGGIARISRWISAGDRKIDSGVGPAPWLTMRSGAGSLEGVEAVSELQECEA